MSSTQFYHLSSFFRPLQSSCRVHVFVVMQRYCYFYRWLTLKWQTSELLFLSLPFSSVVSYDYFKLSIFENKQNTFSFYPLRLIWALEYGVKCITLIWMSHRKENNHIQKQPKYAGVYLLDKYVWLNEWMMEYALCFVMSTVCSYNTLLIFLALNFGLFVQFLSEEHSGIAWVLGLSEFFLNHTKRI